MQGYIVEGNTLNRVSNTEHSYFTVVPGNCIPNPNQPNIVVTPSRTTSQRAQPTRVAH